MIIFILSTSNNFTLHKVDFILLLKYCYYFFNIILLINKINFFMITLWFMCDMRKY